MAEPSILGALRDPQFRSDTLRNLVEALNGAKRSLTVGSLGAVGDMGNTLANLVRAGAGTAYHEATGRPIPQALEYRDPARDFGTSASLGNFAESQGWLPPQTYSMPEQAGALLGPIVAMKAPDLAQSTLRGLVSALKSEPSRRMVDNLASATGAKFNAVPKPENLIDTQQTSNKVTPPEADYRGDHRPPLKDSGAPLHDLTGSGLVYPDDVYSSAAAQYYGHGDPIKDSALFAKIHALKGKPEEMVDVFRAVPKAAFVNGQPPFKHGDWVTISRNYAVEHGEGALNGDYKIMRARFPAKALFTNGDSPYEYGLDFSILGRK
jgi:hypothetical protein